MERPEFTMGIEEEYLLVDRDSRALGVAPEGFIEDCRADLQDQVTRSTSSARSRSARRSVRPSARPATICVGCAPRSRRTPPGMDWLRSLHPATRSRTGRRSTTRQGALPRSGAGPGGGRPTAAHLRCHVHIGIGDNDLRNDLLRQMPYFLPHLLALSTSSPFWQGEDTGLASYRISVFDNLPRTGLPPDYESWAELQRSVGVLIGLGIIEDSSKIWWDIRPRTTTPHSRRGSWTSHRGPRTP